MVSFAQRSDTRVLDEPLYAAYLAATGLPRPYKDLVSEYIAEILYPCPAMNPASCVFQLMAAQVHEGSKVVNEQLLSPPQSGSSQPVLYAKHMAKQKMGISNNLFRRAQHIVRGGVVQSASVLCTVSWCMHDSKRMVALVDASRRT